MKKSNLQIAIDGPAGSGKSTVAKKLAQKFNINYLSTGMIFRYYSFVCKDINYKNESNVKNKLNSINLVFKKNSFYLKNIDITKKISNDKYSNIASLISQYKSIRIRYIKDLTKIIKNNDIVMDGRDIGTKVIPNTKYKYFLNADLSIRAIRRAKQNNIKINSNKFNKLLNDIKNRDTQDQNRAFSPLKKAKGALEIDTTNLTIMQVVNIIYSDICKKS